MIYDEIIQSWAKDLSKLRSDSFVFRMVKVKDIDCIFDIRRIGTYEHFKN